MQESAGLLLRFVVVVSVRNAAIGGAAVGIEVMRHFA